MKKKLLLLLLPLALAGCRGGATPSSDPSVNPSVNPSSHQVNREITEAQWNDLVRNSNAFGVDKNATYVGNIIIKQGQQEYTTEVSLEIDNGKMRSYHKTANGEGELFIDINKESYSEEDKTYEYVTYTTNGDSYRRNAMTFGNRRVTIYDTFIDAGFQFKDATFESATFDGTKYNLTNVEVRGDVVFSTASLAFEDGKLVTFDALMPGYGSVSYTGSKFDTTRVTLPENYTNAFQGQFNFEEFTETEEEVPYIEDLTTAFRDSIVTVTNGELSFYSEKSYTGEVVGSPTSIYGNIDYDGLYNGNYQITSMSVAGEPYDLPESGIGPFVFEFQANSLVVEILIGASKTVHAVFSIQYIY